MGSRIWPAMTQKKVQMPKPKLKTPHVDVCGWVGRVDIVPLTPAINTFPHESRQTSGNHERCQPRSLFRSVSHWGLNMEQEQCACSQALLNVDAWVYLFLDRKQKIHMVRLPKTPSSLPEKQG